MPKANSLSAVWTGALEEVSLAELLVCFILYRTVTPSGRGFSVAEEVFECTLLSKISTRSSPEVDCRDSRCISEGNPASTSALEEFPKRSNELVRPGGSMYSHAANPQPAAGHRSGLGIWMLGAADAIVCLHIAGGGAKHMYARGSSRCNILCSESTSGAQ